MEKKHKNLELRERLDKALASHDLVNEDSIRSLVRDQLLRSSFANGGDAGKVVERRTSEVSNFLDMLRSTSGNKQKKAKAHEASYNEWKIKQDTDQLRVMYREGPQGTPFHTLLIEGHADGPIDVCLCVSLESTLYSKWWPQYNIPTFKIIKSDCLKKVCTGEEISLVRMKVPWPVSDREVILHYFEIEYYKEDLIIILLSNIPDTEDVNISTHGFSRDGIPEANGTVRVDLVGGLVLQKVDSNRCYFRAIADMDIKLDFVPPTLINFISRQLIGNGHKLYQKAVGSVATSDKDYRKALQGPMYVRIREGMESLKQQREALVGLKDEKTVPLLVEHTHDVPLLLKTISVTEIVEEEAEVNLDLNGCSSNRTLTSNEQCASNGNFISPEVEHALRILDQAIAIVRGSGLSHNNDSDCFSIDEELPTSKSIIEAVPISDEAVPISDDTPKCSHDVNNETSYEMEARQGKDFRNIGVECVPREVDNGQRDMSPSKESLLSFHDKIPADAAVTVKQAPVLENMRKACDEISLMANGLHGSNDHKSIPKQRQQQQKKHWLCCLSLGLSKAEKQ